MEYVCALNIHCNCHSFSKFKMSAHRPIAIHCPGETYYPEVYAVQGVKLFVVSVCQSVSQSVCCAKKLNTLEYFKHLLNTSVI